jgi:hypothetical protein
MPITVNHGPDQSRYASVIAQSAKQTENYERMKQISEFMQNVKQQNREYELGKKQNELTGRGQDIQYDLGLKDVGLRDRGYDLQEVNQNRDYELGIRSADQGDRAQTLQEKALAQERLIAERTSPLWRSESYYQMGGNANRGRGFTDYGIYSSG